MSLISEIRQDLDAGALQLIMEYRDRLFTDAVRLCADAASAEDLVSRTLTKAIRNLESHHKDESLVGWMKSIMLNIHRNDMRSPVRRGTTPVDSSAIEEYTEADWKTDEEILKRSDSEALRVALNRLDPEFKKAMVLHYLSEMPVKQIATVMNVPVGTVLWRLNIARKILARDLGEKLGRKPLAVLLAALLGIGTLFGAYQTGLIDAVESLVAEKLTGGAEKFVPNVRTDLSVALALGEESLSRQKSKTSGLLPAVTGMSSPQTGSVQTGLSTSSKQQTQEQQTMKLTHTIAAAALALAGGSSYGQLGTWTGSSWSAGFTPAEGNLVAGMIPTATSGTYSNGEGGKNPALLTDGQAEAGNRNRTQCIANNGILSFDFAAEVSVKEVRIYSTWGDSGRDQVSVSAVNVTDASGASEKIGGSVTYQSTTANCATLAASGAFLAIGVTNVTVKFGAQEAGCVGYAEIEIIGQMGRPSGLTGIAFSSEPGLAPYAATATVLSVVPLSESAVCSWMLNGKTIGGSAPSVELDIAEPGAYALEVTVVDGGEPMTKSVEFFVYPETTYVNVQASNSTFPYWSPETAATNVMDAFNAFKGRRMLVYPGTYSITEQISIGSGKSLVGVGNPDAIVIRQKGANKRAVSVSGAGAEVSGITFAGGYAAPGGTMYASSGAFCHDCRLIDGEPNRNTIGGGCLAVDGAATVVSNCVIGNVVRNTESGTCGIYYGLGLRLNSGLVTDCVITNVQALGMHRSADHKQGAAVHMTGGTLRNTLIAHNVVTDGLEGRDRQFAAGLYQTGGRVENCTITDNTSGSGPAGYYRTSNGTGTMVNTIVWNNTNGDSEGTYGDANLAGTAEAGMSYCCTNDPSFKKASQLDYNLRSDSVCINAGTNLDWMANAVDLGGKRRIRGKKVDIGCYELGPTGLVIYMY